MRTPSPPRTEIEHPREYRRREKLRQYLEAWLRPRVFNEIENAPADARRALVRWVACGAIEHRTPGNPGIRFDQLRKHLRTVLTSTGIIGIEGFFDHLLPTEEALDEVLALEIRIARAAVQMLTRDQLRFVAARSGLGVTPDRYRMDAAYLALKRRTALVEIARDLGLETRLNLRALRATILRRAEEPMLVPLPVPLDLVEVWEEPHDQGRPAPAQLPYDSTREDADDIAALERDLALDTSGVL